MAGKVSCPSAPDLPTFRVCSTNDPRHFIVEVQEKEDTARLKEVVDRLLDIGDLGQFHLEELASLMSRFELNRSNPSTD